MVVVQGSASSTQFLVVLLRKHNFSVQALQMAGVEI
jgi:hypothetical protein